MGKLKLYKIITGILSVLSILALGSAIYSIYLLTGVETFYRIMISLLLILLLITSVYSMLDSVKFFKKKKFIISSICTGILIFIGFIIAIVIFYAYLKLSDMSTGDIIYKTSLISLEEQNKISDLKGIKIGMIDHEEDPEGYILPTEVIEKYKLKDKNEIIKYSDTITLMSALINKEVDAIFVSSKYESMFKNIEGLKEDQEIYEIASYEKKYKKPASEKTEEGSKVKLTEPFTVLLLGVDEEGETFNGDTIMLISFDPETLHATMFSIPRDTYTTICSGGLTKITHSGWGGTKCVVQTVEDFTGLDVDYYVRINFKGVIDLVNALDGITVDVPMDFCESNSDRLIGPDYEICLNKGVQKLNGEQALALARHRKTLPLGDFQRGQNQQLVVEGMLNQIKTLRSPNDFYNVLNIVSKNIDTSMSTDEMLSFYNIGKSIITKDSDASINITKTFLTGYDLYVYEGYSYAYTFQYYKQSLDAIIKAMKINLKQLEQEEIKTISFSINKPYEKTIIGYEYYSEPRRSLIPDFTQYSLGGAETWASSNGFTITTETVESNDPSHYNGQIIAQSVHDGVLLEKAPKNIVLSIVKKVEGEPSKPTTPEKPDDEEPTVPGLPTDPDIPENPDTTNPGENPEEPDNSGEDTDEDNEDNES